MTTLAKPSTFTFKTVGSHSLEADVYGPLRTERPRPVIVWIHGGALVLGGRASIIPDQVHAFLGAGFTVISIDYRLAPETKLAGLIEDLVDAFDWVRRDGPKLLGIDPQRLAALGHSAGGYLALMSGFCVAPRPKALVSFYGYGDITSQWMSEPDPYYCSLSAVTHAEAAVGLQAPGSVVVAGDGPRGSFYLYCRQQGIWPREVTGLDLATQNSDFDPYCPIRNVTPDYPPALLLHGDRDEDVPYSESVNMAAELARHGVEHELITLPGGGHGFGGADPTAIAAAFQRAETFLKAHI